MKKALFIDRDGTLVVEPPVDYQLDSFHKLEFYPKVFRNLGFIRSKLDFEFVMVTNQDGLGTSSFPEDTFWPVHNLVLKTLEGEGIIFDDILIDRSFPEDHVSTRKPGTGMMGKYLPVIMIWLTVLLLVIVLPMWNWLKIWAVRLFCCKKIWIF